MDLIGLGAIIYFVNIMLSLSIAILIINKLYISKKFTKEKDFHHYNDLFSWEAFYLLIGIANGVKILSTYMPLDIEVSNLLLKFRIFIYFFPFWMKIIHLEKVMEKITYERHFLGALIPLVMVIVLIVTGLRVYMLALSFLMTALIPFLIFFIFLKNTGTKRINSLKTNVGAVFIGIGYFFRPEILLDNADITEILGSMINITSFIAPISLVLGTLLIFESFRKNM